MIFRFLTKSSYQLALLSLNGFFTWQWQYSTKFTSGLHFTFSFSFFSSSGFRTNIFTVPILKLACKQMVNTRQVLIIDPTSYSSAASAKS